ncbi:hypothetical protein Tco_0706249 [Tanacetum coccineum]|uniref:Uncharacterized protein n=1 Tax=Tanacetum coccineum TaxID=301880 RepID=A0ABQ4Y6V2_9ASTR
MLLLLVQQKLTNLTIDERYDLNVALRMYTRRIIIQKRVEDLQLGVESYQKKLNLSKPDSYRSNLRNKTAYTSYSDPHGIVYVDLNKRKRLMRVDELYKFSDGTLNDVRQEEGSGYGSGYRQAALSEEVDAESREVHCQNQRDLPRDIPLDSVVVLRYEKRSKSENKGIVPTEMELLLEQTQQGTSHEVSVSAEGVEELKRKVKINGEKKEALLTLKQKPGQYICCFHDHKEIARLEDCHHRPSDAMHNPPQPLKISQKIFVSFLTKITRISINFLTPVIGY